MTPSGHNQGQQQGNEEQAAAEQSEPPADRTTSRRRWIKAAGLVAVPLIITVKAQPAFAAKPKASKGTTAVGKNAYKAGGKRG